ncbi:MAG TPA: hypothetical protein VK438_06220 [Xanthobacteraceae bacterium]|nr:hypothetical protein [Xanthobacteraceae bacterium]
MLKPALAWTTAAAIALGGLSLQPAAAAQQPAPAIAKYQAHDFSAVRKKRRRYGRGFPLAAFGAIVGTIAGIAAANQQPPVYAAPYYGGPYEGPYYEEPDVYVGPDVYYGPGYYGPGGIPGRRFIGPRGGGQRQFTQRGFARAPGFARPQGSGARAGGHPQGRR